MWCWLLWKSLKVKWEKVHPGVVCGLHIIERASPFTALNAIFIPHKIGFSSSLTAASRYQTHRICRGRRGIFNAKPPLPPLLGGKWNVESYSSAELLYSLITEKRYSPRKVINIAQKCVYEQVNGSVFCNRPSQLQRASTCTDEYCRLGSSDGNFIPREWADVKWSRLSSDRMASLLVTGLNCFARLELPFLRR